MTDEELMGAVKSGNLQHASVLFDRYHKRIYNFIARMTFNREAAEDLTQNVFFRMIQYRQSYHQGQRFQSWIYQIARNVFADHYREAQRQQLHRVDLMRVGDPAAADYDFVQDEQEKILHRALQQLPEEQRELLVLTRFQHMKYEEAADLLDTTVANIKVKVHRAIQKLRDHYFELEKHE